MIGFTSILITLKLANQFETKYSTTKIDISNKLEKTHKNFIYCRNY